jgi:hypothetical protein
MLLTYVNPFIVAINKAVICLRILWMLVLMLSLQICVITHNGQCKYEEKVSATLNGGLYLHPSTQCIIVYWPKKKLV